MVWPCAVLLLFNDHVQTCMLEHVFGFSIHLKRTELFTQCCHASPWLNVLHWPWSYMVVYVIPCLAFALNMLDHVIMVHDYSQTWFLCYSMLSFCLEHGWSWYIMVHDYGLTWLSMLFHVLPWAFCLEHGWSCYIMVSFSPFMVDHV